MVSTGVSRACASHAAHRDNLRSELRPEEWLVIEWPEGEAEPTKYWLSTLPPDIPFDKLVDAIKLRWRIERDYQELKQEVGLGRRSRVARLPPPRHAVHRRLWVPDRRKADDSPLRAPRSQALPNICRFPLSTIHATRPSDPSIMSQTRSRPFDDD